MKSWIPVLALGMIGSAVAPSTALACGGCFAPPGAVQVVTDHRMALSLSADRTILWDQFRYSGRPSDFSWILPIQNGPDVRIEVADNRFLTALDNLSAPVLNAPQRPYCETEADTAFGGLRSAAAPPAADAGVAVLQEQVVASLRRILQGFLLGSAYFALYSESRSHYAHAGHLGGAMTGVAYALWRRARRG
jgi:hypothetical protein